MISLHYGNNLDYIAQLIEEQGLYFDLIYADCIYESRDFKWFWESLRLLKDNGIFIVQTDYHTSADYKKMIDYLVETKGYVFVSWCIYKQEWGGKPRKGFPIKHDDILIFAKGKDYKWYGERIQIPKVTAGTKFDKKGTGLKTPCSVFDDLGNFSTISKERIKDSTGKNVKWQKSMKLMDRLLLPFTDEGDIVFDPFLGSGTTAVWSKKNNRNFYGCEVNPEVFQIAEKRLSEN